MSRLRRKSEIRRRAETDAHRLQAEARAALAATPEAGAPGGGWRDVLVERLSAGASVTAAARAAGVSRNAVYKARARDRQFAAQCDAALAGRARPMSSRLQPSWEPEIVPVFHGGLQIGARERIDAAAMLRMLRSAQRQRRLASRPRLDDEWPRFDGIRR